MSIIFRKYFKLLLTSHKISVISNFSILHNVSHILKYFKISSCIFQYFENILKYFWGFNTFYAFYTAAYPTFQKLKILVMFYVSMFIINSEN